LDPATIQRSVPRLHPKAAELRSRVFNRTADRSDRPSNPQESRTSIGVLEKVDEHRAIYFVIEK
jgi:hypothetical protein